MSAALYLEIRAKSAFLDQDHSLLCAFVHGVFAGFLVANQAQASAEIAPIG
jgi:hypothetical protein